MTKQSKAQRLADWLDNADSNFYSESSLWFDGKLADKVGEAVGELRRLDAMNAELIKALEKLARLGNGDQYGNSIGNDIAKAALAKAREQTNE